MEIGSAMKARRTAQKKSVEELATAASISVSYWEKLEAGQAQNPSLQKIVAIAKALGCTTKDLLYPELTAA